MNKSIVILAALGLGATAYAGDMDTTKSFNDLDTNKDGLLTKEEAAADQSISAEFTTADTNQDGYVTAAEFDAVQGDEYSEEEDAE
jgi:Ca2+-binding EF-hand superfamily protein